MTKISLKAAAVVITAAGLLPSETAMPQSAAQQATNPMTPVPPVAPRKLYGFKMGPVMNSIKPGEFFIDPPTLENFGFRWYVEGDSNRNAAVEVFYRKQGEGVWKPALPMLRVHHEIADWNNEAYRTGNLFAGSVFGLQPVTAYNGYFGVLREGVLFRWSDGKNAKPYPSLTAFSAATGHEKHGRMIDLSIFENAPPPQRGFTHQPEEYDLRLRAGANALDAGVLLPNINDDFTGTAPDLGAYERGRAVPHYGPRSLQNTTKSTG